MYLDTMMFDNSSSPRFNTSMWPQKLSTETRPSGDRHESNHAFLCRRKTFWRRPSGRFVGDLPWEFEGFLTPKLLEFWAGGFEGAFQCSKRYMWPWLIAWETLLKGPKTHGHVPARVGGSGKQSVAEISQKYSRKFIIEHSATPFWKRVCEFGVHTGRL